MTTDDREVGSEEPIDPDVIWAITLVCIVSGGILVSAFAMPGMVGKALSPEMVLAAGMLFAASFLITISLLPAEEEERAEAI